VEHGKKFLIIGPRRSPTRRSSRSSRPTSYGSGVSPTAATASSAFQTTTRLKFAAGCTRDENGVKYIRVKGVRWYTNLDHGRRHQKLPLMTMEDNLKFSKHKEIKGKAAYDRYDNYDAIEVPFTDAIPSDYDGVMGVPITFLDKYNPDQFEILGYEKSYHLQTRKYEIKFKSTSQERKAT
jgi:hypothetical protein